MPNPVEDTAAPRKTRGAFSSLEDMPAARALALLFGLNLVLRGLLARFNTAEYTDGILQLTQFSEPTSLWPPLYSALAALLGLALGPLDAGRMVSVLAGALGWIPLWMLARRTAGGRAAFYTALLYTLAPVSLRWSARVMSDMLFSACFWAALERWDAAERALRALHSPAGGQQTPRGPDRRWDGPLAAAILWTAAAMLVRYQGILLVPLLLWTGLRGMWPSPASGQRCFSIPWRSVGAAISLALAPGWVLWKGMAHGEQFDARLGSSAFEVFRVLSINGEAFLLLTPYFLTYPVAWWVLSGWFRGRGGAGGAGSGPNTGGGGGGGGGRATLGLATLYSGLAVLLLQSAFSSFQERYLMPWLGLLWVWGGIGLAEFQGRMAAAGRRRVFSLAAGVTLVWSAFMALGVLALQRDAFGDFAVAGRWLRLNAPAEAPIYSNEIYNANLGGRLIATNKIRFYSGREVRYLFDVQTGAISTGTLPPGALVCVHSAYGPPDLEALLQSAYECRQVFEVRSSLIPLFPDIMERPGTAQNPTAWIFRFERQRFRTAIWRIEGPRH